ncbi:LysR substrate-binding domain-containing protein [uncultured Rhodoblastus sp.]|uniref:LysR substrate-binding domain-containing protein n=1 Tax=uncultured Rhodoblastus sp. TaxID=543037 RepID=UPI0025D4ECE6|nr:LysR substrate-binding domain-containing protein [uncultured Rhodoblastus sp.]
MKTFDPELLLTLVAFAETGSLAAAASRVGRTPSAITAQMQRLEESAGVALLEAAGRGRSLTEAGAQLVIHARRILNANNEAWLSLAGAAADSRVALGVTQDFADTDLPLLLNLFARSHPRVRIDLRVGRSSELWRQLGDGGVDIAVAMRRPLASGEMAVIVEPMYWLMARQGLVVPTDEMPLAVLDPPCGFRDAALQSLENIGRPYRLAATSPSLSGLRAAVRAGIAVTARTRRWLGPDMMEATAQLRLPNLPKAEFSINLRAGGDRSAAQLAAILAEGLASG